MHSNIYLTRLLCFSSGLLPIADNRDWKRQWLKPDLGLSLSYIKDVRRKASRTGGGLNSVIRNLGSVSLLVPPTLACGFHL